MSKPNSKPAYHSKVVDQLEARRIALGLSLADLEEVSGYTFTYWSAVKRGVKNPSLEAVERFAHAMGCDVRIVPRENWTPRTRK